MLLGFVLQTTWKSLTGPPKMNPMVTLVQFNFTIICILIHLLGLSCTLSAEDILIPKFTLKFGWLELDF